MITNVAKYCFSVIQIRSYLRKGTAFASLEC